MPIAREVLSGLITFSNRGYKRNFEMRSLNLDQLRTLTTVVGSAASRLRRASQSRSPRSACRSKT